MKELLNQIAAQIEVFQKESAAHAKRNKAAGGRTRKATLELTNCLRILRRNLLSRPKNSLG